MVVRGQPFLHWQLRYLQTQGVREVLLCLSYLAPVVQEYFKQHPVPGIKLHYSIEVEPLGTGGALRLALGQLPQNFWLLNGDSFFPVKMAEMHHGAIINNSFAVIATTANPPASARLNLKLQGRVVTDYIKTGDQTCSHVDAGLYWLPRQVIAEMPEGPFDLGALWPRLISTHSLIAHEFTESFFDIGTPERLQVFSERLIDVFPLAHNS